MGAPVFRLRFDADLTGILRIAENRPRRGLLRVPRGKGSEISCALTRRASVKDVVESLGVPHTEVHAIRNAHDEDRELDFGHVPESGETLEIRGARPPVDVTRPTVLRPRPLKSVIFAVDVNVGGLARLLRLLGLDVFHENPVADDRLARVADEEGRIALSRDLALLKRRRIVHGRLVRSATPEEQLAEILTLYGLSGPFRPFSRCLRCNDPLRPVAKAEVLHRLEPLTRKHYENFHICPACGRVYWAGSHHEAMRRRLARLGIEMLD